jgi:HEAT repeat protein
MTPGWVREDEMDRESGTMAGGNQGIRFSSGTAVSRFRKPLVEYLISGLEENDKWVRILAADMLGSVGDSQAVKYLKPLLVDRDYDLRVISAHAIESIHSHHDTSSRTQPDPCASCMIRLIAEEALIQQKP